jgi:SulP family sulfate permease
VRVTSLATARVIRHHPARVMSGHPSRSYGRGQARSKETRCRAAGLFLGIAISLLLLVYRVSRPNVAVLGRVPGTADQYVDVARHPEDGPPPGVVVLRVESGLFFANAEHVRDTIRKHVGDDTKAVVIDAETVPYIDVSAARMLEELAADLQRDGVALVIARDIGQVRDVLRQAGADEPLVQVHRTIQEAVDAVLIPER